MGVVLIIIINFVLIGVVLFVVANLFIFMFSMMDYGLEVLVKTLHLYEILMLTNWRSKKFQPTDRHEDQYYPFDFVREQNSSTIYFEKLQISARSNLLMVSQSLFYDKF